MRPQTTALLDQAQAATSEASAIFGAFASIEGGDRRHGIPGPASQALLDRLPDRARAGKLTLCQHLSWDAPRPAFWFAWAPGRLRCPGCGQAVNNRIHGTTEDRRCDHCNRIRPTIHRRIMQLPPVVIETADGPLCIPPLLVMYGLCPACHQLDSTGEGTPA